MAIILRRRLRHTTLQVERIDERARRKFAGGFLEQAGNILGAVAWSVLAVGLIGPYIAAITGSSHVPAPVLVNVAMSAFAFAVVTAGASMTLRGLARRADDDGRFHQIEATHQRRDTDH